MSWNEAVETGRLPLQCLAVYDDEDRLLGVFPYSTDDRTRTVADCPRCLETGAVCAGPNDG
ncbi:MAG: HTH domain-containing protein [Haloferacaceae archaeon]